MFSHCAHCGLDGGEVSGRGAATEKEIFFFFFFNYCSCSTPFYVLMAHCPGLSLWATARRRPRRRDWGTVPRPDVLFHGILSFFTAGEGRAERCSGDGCCRVGWSERVPSTKFLPETTACLVTPLFLQIRIVCTLINKLYLGLAGWHVSAMEIISVREKMCLYVKHF